MTWIQENGTGRHKSPPVPFSMFSAAVIYHTSSAAPMMPKSCFSSANRNSTG